MKATLRKKAPSITNMIRLDHGHVMALFHRFRADVSTGKKQALVTNACLAIETHAQLEEEIFYPALRMTASGGELIGKSEVEHGEMRRLILELRAMKAGDPTFDERFLELMRVVVHHVADEESILLPAAESRLPDQLGELGLRMTKRRMELLAPHLGEVVTTTARSFPGFTTLITAATIAVGGRMLFSRRRTPTVHRH